MSWEYMFFKQKSLQKNRFSRFFLTTKQTVASFFLVYSTPGPPLFHLRSSKTVNKLHKTNQKPINNHPGTMKIPPKTKKNNSCTKLQPKKHQDPMNILSNKLPNTKPETPKTYQSPIPKPPRNHQRNTKEHLF